MSKHVAELQRDLGVCLIKNSPRAELTYEGKALALYLTRHFDEIAALLEELGGPGAPTGYRRGNLARNDVRVVWRVDWLAALARVHVLSLNGIGLRGPGLRTISD